MMWIVLLLLVGICLSALFSGSETGFYRVSRVRLVLDGIDGNGTSRRILSMTNNPSLFIATTLVGNNIANYLASLGIVLATQRLFGLNLLMELLAPMALAPVLFIYGESLPKSLFLKAPNKLLHLTHPLLLFFGLLFAPMSALLWGLGRAMQALLGRSPESIQLVLARRELEQVLQEGHEAGILKPVQYELAQSLFTIANQPIKRLAIPLSRLKYVRENHRREDALRLAKNWRISNLPVKPAKGNRLIGYKSVVELRLQQTATVGPSHELISVNADDTFCSVLLRMQTERESMARVVSANGETIGVVAEYQLSELLGVNYGATRS